MQGRAQDQLLLTVCFRVSHEQDGDVRSHHQSWNWARALHIGEAGESIIENSLDVVVVFLRVTPRVKIHCVRVLRVQNDEGAVFVSAQNNSNRPSSSN